MGGLVRCAKRKYYFFGSVDFCVKDMVYKMIHLLRNMLSVICVTIIGGRPILGENNGYQRCNWLMILLLQ